MQVHKEVSSTLAGMGVAHTLDAPLEEGLISIDIALQSASGANVAISVDASTHFSVNAPYRPLGKTLLRWRMLTARGWKVSTMQRMICIPAEGLQSDLLLLRI